MHIFNEIYDDIINWKNSIIDGKWRLYKNEEFSLDYRINFELVKRIVSQVFKW
jgi:hypothetical protein